MIKVNLLRNRGGTGVNPGKTTTEINYEMAYDETNLEESNSARDVIVKLVLMFMGTGALMAYESYNIGELRDRLRKLSSERAVLAQEIEEKKPIATKAREMQKHIQELEARIKAIKDLSKVRLREIKVIDFLQNVIPERTWLTSLDFSEGTLTIEGGALSDDQLNKFIDAMESKTYFKNVILSKAIEQRSEQGTVKIFTITSTLANTD